MGSRGGTIGSGIPMNDGSTIKASDLNEFSTWQEIGDFGFSDVKIRYDGEMLKQAKNSPLAVVRAMGQKMADGHMSAYNASGAKGVAQSMLQKPFGGRLNESSFLEETLDKNDKITIESKELSNALTPVLTKKGYTLVGSSAPTNYMPYFLWRKNK